MSKGEENRILKMYPRSVLIAAVFTKSKIQKQPKCLSMNKWINKIYFNGYYSAMRKKNILPFLTTWINFEGMMLSEISQR